MIDVQRDSSPPVPCGPRSSRRGTSARGICQTFAMSYSSSSSSSTPPADDEAPWSSSVPWNTAGGALASGRASGGKPRKGIPRTIEECREQFIGYRVYAVDDDGDDGRGDLGGGRRRGRNTTDGRGSPGEVLDANEQNNMNKKPRSTVPVGIVDDVMCAGDDHAADVDDGLGDYFLLKVVAPHLHDEGSESTLTVEEQDGDIERHVEEQHLIPLVPSIVPVIDASKELLVISPPPGLLELGRRQAALARIDRLLRKSGIVSSVYIESPDGFQEELKPRMPTRRELEEMGRHDVVKLVLENGGFLDVAQCLGYRGRRKPPGYWEDEEVLDRELSLFVGQGWIRMEALDSDEESSDESSDDRLWSKEQDDDKNDKNDHPHGILGENEDVAEPDGEHGRNDVIDSADGRERSDVSSTATTYNSYWYNTVTRQLRWTKPTPPQIIPLDDMGINSIIVETEEDRAMPSRSSLLAAGRYDLHTAIVSQGGYAEVSDALNRWPAWPPTRKLRNIKTLKSEIMKFIREHQLDKRFLPAASDFLDLGRPDIHQVIVARFGGYKEVGRRIGLRSHRGGGVDWRDFDAVCREVTRYCTEHGLEHLPTHEALRQRGRHDLRHALQKWGSARVSEATGVALRNARGGWKKKKLSNNDV